MFVLQLFYSINDCFNLSTEDCLIKRLTKINRMDIVHLIETQMNKSVQEQTSRTYAEIEKTLDHSEGTQINHQFESSISNQAIFNLLLAQCSAYSSSVCFFSVSSPIFSSRGCRQPPNRKKGGVRPQTTPSCF